MKILTKILLLCIAYCLTISNSFAQQNTCGQAGANPLTIPYTLKNATSCGYSNDFNNGVYCGTGNMGFEDIFYSFVATSPSMKITLTNIKYLNSVGTNTFPCTQQYVYVGLFTDCTADPLTPGASCVDNATEVMPKNGILPEMRFWIQDELEVGKKYYVVVDGDNACITGGSEKKCYNYDITIENMPWVTTPAKGPCENADFEKGTFDGWVGWSGNNNGNAVNWRHRVLGSPAKSIDAGTWREGIVTTGINAISTTTANRHTIMRAPGVDDWSNPGTNSLSIVPPGGGTYAVRVGNQSSKVAEMERVAHKFKVDNSNAFFEFQYAVVLQLNGRVFIQQSGYFDISIYGPNNEIIDCFRYSEYGTFTEDVGASAKGFIRSQQGLQDKTAYYKPWTRVQVNLAKYIGQDVTIVATSMDGFASGFCYGYLDINCTNNGFKLETTKYLCNNVSVDLVGPPNFDSYLWKGPPPANLTYTTQVISATAVGVYTLTLPQYCVKEPITYTVLPSNLPLLTANLASNTASNCVGQSNGSFTVNPSGGSGSYTYAWAPNKETTKSINNLPSGNYTVTVTGSKDCSINVVGTISTTPTDNSSFNYTGGTFCKTGSVETPTISGVKNGVFTFTPSSLSINLATGAVNPVSSPISNYTITYTTKGSCPSTSSVVVNVTDSPKANFEFNGPFCKNYINELPKLLNGASVGKFTATPTLSITPSSGLVDLINSNPGKYTITNLIPASGGCAEAVFTNTLIINDSPLALVAKDKQICGGKTMDIGSASVAGNTYTWTSIPAGFSSNSSNPNVIPVGKTEYILTEMNAAGCLKTNTVVITASKPLTASFIADPLRAEAPAKITFTNTSTNVINNKWSFGNGDSSKLSDPVYGYTELGKFNVCLFTNDGDKCAESVCQEIEIYVVVEVNKPNVFTPNNDGVNDIFKFKTKGLKTLNVEIYNRWGQKMYEWSTLNGGWDGVTPNGGLAPDGTYFYFLNGVALDGKEYPEDGKKAKGSFTLLR